MISRPVCDRCHRGIFARRCWTSLEGKSVFDMAQRLQKENQMQHNIFPDIKVKVRAHGPHMQRGGGGGCGQGGSNPIATNCG